MHYAHEFMYGLPCSLPLHWMQCCFLSFLGGAYTLWKRCPLISSNRAYKSRHLGYLHYWSVNIHTENGARSITIHLLEQWIISINHHYLPISFVLIQKTDDAQNLDLLDLAHSTDTGTNLNHINGVVVALLVGVWWDEVGVFPCLSFV